MRHPSFSSFAILVLAGGLWTIASRPVFAACDLPLAASDVVISPSAPLANQPVRFYVTVHPECAQDIEGAVSFFTDGTPLTAKPFSYKSQGRAEEVWAVWVPTAYGSHVVRVETLGDGGSIGHAVDLPLFVDRDSDGDGVPDARDDDDDNDGVPDARDQFPLDPKRSLDTDRDGIDDAVDSDKDNDGLYDFQERKLATDPLKRDTDRDGVGDKQDAFPLDSERQKAPSSETESGSVNAVEDSPKPADKTIPDETAESTSPPASGGEIGNVSSTVAVAVMDAGASTKEPDAKKTDIGVLPRTADHWPISSRRLLWLLPMFTGTAGVFFLRKSRKR